MKQLVVLGAGTAGTMVANRLRRELSRSEWQVMVVDRDNRHLYQPGLLLVPFGRYRAEDLVRPRRDLLNDGIDLLEHGVERIRPELDEVVLDNGWQIHYDHLVIATGVEPRPDQTPGMLDGGEWRESIFDFYTYEGAVALEAALRDFDGGRLVVHVVDTPIKCPVAPLEFAFLADEFLRQRGVRERTELVYATPLPGAFTKPVATRRLTALLADRDIVLETDFLVERVEKRSLVSFDERTIDFDLLVTVPLNMGADFVARSGLGNELNLVPVDRRTMRSTAWPNISALGDANDIPTSKAGSVAHFSAEVFARNFLRQLRGEPQTEAFDGHANCFVETGHGKALLIDFNYDTQPLPGTYPLPVVGPFRLLGESRLNHWGKLAFRWLYWNVLLPGRPLPLPSAMSMSGKQNEE